MQRRVTEPRDRAGPVRLRDPALDVGDVDVNRSVAHPQGGSAGKADHRTGAPEQVGRGRDGDSVVERLVLSLVQVHRCRPNLSASNQPDLSAAGPIHDDELVGARVALGPVAAHEGAQVANRERVRCPLAVAALVRIRDRRPRRHRRHRVFGRVRFRGLDDDLCKRALDRIAHARDLVHRDAAADEPHPLRVGLIRRPQRQFTAHGPGRMPLEVKALHVQPR